MAKWQLQAAKARFSQLIDETLEKGPQVVTRRGVETAVVLSIDEWHRLQQAAKPNWKSVLLGGPRFEIPLPDRRKLRSRKPVEFE